MGTLQCVLKWESGQGGRNREARRKCEDPESKPPVVGSKPESELLLCDILFFVYVQSIKKLGCLEMLC